MICGAIYGHHNGNLEHFLKYLDSTIDKIHREKKLMGDLNADLLKITSHAASIMNAWVLLLPPTNFTTYKNK